MEVDSVAGVAAFALVVLSLGYLVPHRVRQREQWAQARSQDRFSGSLRVLAVAGPQGTQPQRQLQVDGATTPPTIVGEAAGGGPPALERRHSVSADTTRSRDEEGTYAVETNGTKASASVRRERPLPPSRLQLLERRAAAARRRLVLTIVLLFATVAAGVAGGLGYVMWWWAAVPLALLVLVLVLGRHAAKEARRSDAEWLAEHRAALGRSPRTARPAVPTTRSGPPRVTGRAVHSSSASTQMIPRVTAHDLERARAAAREVRSEAHVGADETDAESNAVADGPAVSVVESLPERGSTAPDHDTTPSRSAAAVAQPDDDAAVSAPVAAPGPAPWETYPPSSRVWDPVPVPPPTYTMKASAPQMPVDVGAPDASAEPDDAGSAPVGAPPAAGSSAGAASVGGVPSGPTPVAGPVPTRAAGDEPHPKTETLGLDLNEILARRRAAGQ